MTDEYTPTTEQVRDGYRFDPVAEYHDPITPHHVINGRAFDRWLAAHEAEVRQDEREKVAREIEALKPALTQWIAAYETHDAAVWAESPEEGAADLVERIARIARGGGV